MRYSKYYVIPQKLYVHSEIITMSIITELIPTLKLGLYDIYVIYTK